MKRYISSSEDDSRFDLFHGHTYWISGNDGRHRDMDKYVDDPEQAITYWFKIGKTHRYHTSIMTKLRSDAVKLCEAGTPELLTDLYEQYGCPYKLDFLIETCEDEVASNARDFYENELGDQIAPFGVG